MTPVADGCTGVSSGFEYDRVGAAAHEVGGSGEPDGAGSDYDDGQCAGRSEFGGHDTPRNQLQCLLTITVLTVDNKESV